MFSPKSEARIMVKDFKLVKEIADEWGINQRTVQTMCANGKIPGATKVGNTWIIPAEASRPGDGRLKKDSNQKEKRQ